MTTETAPHVQGRRDRQPGEPVEFEVDRERIAAYAAATNDSIRRPRRGRPRAAGVRGRPRLPGRRDGEHAGDPGRAARRDPPRRAGLPLPPPDRARDDAEHDRDADRDAPALLRGHRRDPGRDPRGGRRARGRAVHGPPSSAAPRGSRTSARRPRGTASTRRCASASPTPRSRRPSTPTRPIRYAEASGDPMQIHLDEEFAKAVGLPGIIIHGLCTMAFTSVAAIEHACCRRPDPAASASRSASPASRSPSRRSRPGSGRRAGDGRTPTPTRPTSDAGAVVIKDGLAEVGLSSRARRAAGGAASPSAARRPAGGCSTPPSRA